MNFGLSILRKLESISNSNRAEAGTLTSSSESLMKTNKKAKRKQTLKTSKTIQKQKQRNKSPQQPLYNFLVLCHLFVAITKMSFRKICVPINLMKTILSYLEWFQERKRHHAQNIK